MAKSTRLARISRASPRKRVKRVTNSTKFDVENIVIDNDVPEPELRTKIIYPFERLKPGQSFFIPGKTYSNIKGRARKFLHERKGSTIKFELIVRPVGADTKKALKLSEKGVGVRVWRKTL